MPGVLWPTTENGDARHLWVNRCDECCVYPSDYHAAAALLERFLEEGWSGHELETGYCVSAAGSVAPYLDIKE